MSGYPTSTNIPRVDGLSTDPREMRRHKEKERRRRRNKEEEKKKKIRVWNSCLELFYGNYMCMDYVWKSLFV